MLRQAQQPETGKIIRKRDASTGSAIGKSETGCFGRLSNRRREKNKEYGMIHQLTDRKAPGLMRVKMLIIRTKTAIDYKEINVVN
jgi:hypothetical protein